MAPSGTASRNEGRSRERDKVLATKVKIPQVRRDRLHRAGLIARLDAGAARNVIMVCSPAGFGKTTLLAEWATEARMDVAWLSLDPEDNDPVRFWRYVIVALDGVSEGVERGILPFLDPSGGVSGRGLVTALINMLESSPNQLGLVLDDYHAIESPAIHDDVAFLLSQVSPRLHLVIASRTDPPLPLARLRARGQIAELRERDLRFTSEEASALLREVWKLDLSPEDMAALEARTEGWPVGLHLAALSMVERSDAEAFIGAFTGTHRYVLDFLSEEVLQRQPDRIRIFLLQTSILDRLCGALCDAVTGTSDGQGMLEELERRNLFLIPMDDERRWYRFHHLFSDLLRARLQRDGSFQVPELHKRAASWCEQHGLLDDAIRHALASGDELWAARLVEEHMGEILRRDEGVILSRWLSALPEEVVRTSPNLCLAQGWMQLHIGHLDAAERLADHAERAFDHADGASGELELPTVAGMVTEAPAAIALLRADLAAARGDLDGLARSAGYALAQMGPNERGPRYLARFQLACVDWMAGRLTAAEQAFAQMLDEGRAAPDPYPLETSCFALGQVQAGLGKLGAALRTNRRSLALATAGGRMSAFNAAEAHIGIAQVLYQRDELDEALPHANAGIDLCRHAVEFVLPAVGLLTLAWIRHAMGQEDAALEAADEACRIRPNRPPAFVALWNPAEAERARLLLVQGRIEDAQRWADEWGLTDDDEISYTREREHLVLVRLLLARHDAARAIDVLDRLETLAGSQGRQQSLIEMGVLRSLALQSSGAHEDALTTLRAALSKARPEGYVRVCADEGPTMAALVQSLIRQRQVDRSARSPRAREHLLRVARAFRIREQPRGEVVSATQGVEPLTARELEILRFLAEGRRNHDIARELVVTSETVKKHVSHILGKLGASSRTEAVARARGLGLIS